MGHTSVEVSFLIPASCILWAPVDMPPVEGDSEAFTLENEEETEKIANVDMDLMNQESLVMDAKTANRNLAAEIAALLAEGEEEGVGEEIVAPLAPFRRRRSKVAEEGDMNDRRSSCFLTEIDDHDDDLQEVSKQEGKPSIVDFYLKKQASEEEEGYNLEEPSVIGALDTSCSASGTEDTETEFPVNGDEDIHEQNEETIISEEDNCNFPTYFDLFNLQVGCSVNNGSRGEYHQGVSGSQGGAGYASKGAKRGFSKCHKK